MTNNIPINWSNVTNLAQLPAEANNTTGGIFWPSILVGLFIIFKLMFDKYGNETSLLLSSFFTLILSLLFLVAQLIDLKTFLIFLGLTILIIPYIYWSSKRTD